MSSPPPRGKAYRTSFFLPHRACLGRPPCFHCCLHQSVLGGSLSTCPVSCVGWLCWLVDLYLHPSIHSITQFYRFQILNIPHICLLLFSSLPSAPDWLGQGFLPRINAWSPTGFPVSISPSSKPSSKTQIEPNHSCFKPFDGSPIIHPLADQSRCLLSIYYMEGAALDAGP